MYPTCSTCDFLFSLQLRAVTSNGTEGNTTTRTKRVDPRRKSHKHLLGRIFFFFFFFNDGYSSCLTLSTANHFRDLCSYSNACQSYMVIYEETKKIEPICKNFDVSAPKLQKSTTETKLLVPGQTTETSVSIDVSSRLIDPDQGHIVMAGCTVCVKSADERCERGMDSFLSVCFSSHRPKHRKRCDLRDVSAVSVPSQQKSSSGIHRGNFF